MSHFKLSTILVLLVAAAGAWAQIPGEFEPFVSYSIGQEAQTVAVGDLNGDGRDDVVVTAYTPSLYVFYQQADGTLLPSPAIPTPYIPLKTAVADLNGDALSELITAGNDGQVSIYYQQPDGTMAAPVTYYTYGAATGIAIGDFNSDGLADIATCTGSIGYIFVLYQTPAGDFGLPSFYPVNSPGAWGIARIDYNSDGKDDLAVLLYDQIGYLEQNEAGAFQQPVFYYTPQAFSFTAGDVTGDGLDDLIYTADDYQLGPIVGVYSQADFFGYPPVVYTVPENAAASCVG